MKKRNLLVLMCLCVWALGACGVGEGSCDEEAPNVTERGTEQIQVEDTLQGEIEATEETQEPAGPAAEGEGPEGLPTPEVSSWGITLTAKDITSTGLTLVCTQSGGSPTGELNSGSYYVLEKSEEGSWGAVDYANPEMEVGWDAVAWTIPMDDSVEWKVDWEWLYGSLSAGHYRIGKEITDFRASGDYDKEYYYAEFEIEE